MSCSSDDAEKENDYEDSEDSVIGNIGSKKKKKKHVDDRDYHIDYKKGKSDATINVDEIESFIYGPTSARFWTTRKHINSAELRFDPKGNLLTKLPFYAWECISLSTKDQARTIDLVIP